MTTITDADKLFKKGKEEIKTSFFKFKFHPDYINAVVEIDTTLTPLQLLNKLLKIELQHGRVRTFRNAPRTLDLDILLYDKQQLNDEKLTIPHPRMTQRAFVMYPLMEIAQHCVIPGHGKISQLITACSDQKIERLSNY